MKMMTRDEIIRQAVTAVERRRYLRQIRRIAAFTCEHLNITPYEQQLVGYIGDASCVDNYQAVLTWILRHHGDYNEAGCPLSQIECADELEIDLNRKLPPHLLGDSS